MYVCVHVCVCACMCVGACVRVRAEVCGCTHVCCFVGADGCIPLTMLADVYQCCLLKYVCMLTAF